MEVEREGWNHLEVSLAGREMENGAPVVVRRVDRRA